MPSARPSTGRCRTIPVKEFATISTIGAFDLVLATKAWNPSSRRLPSFSKRARAQPGKLNVGTINVGGTQNLAAELLKASAGVDFQIVPYRGTPDVIVALLRNDVQLLAEFYAPIKPTLLDKKIRAVATTGPRRSPFFPDVPTVAEAGVPGYEVVSWNGIFARTGTAAEIIDVLNSAIREIVAIPEGQGAIRRARHRGQGELARGAQAEADRRHRQMGGRDPARRDCQAEEQESRCNGSLGDRWRSSKVHSKGFFPVNPCNGGQRVTAERSDRAGGDQDCARRAKKGGRLHYVCSSGARDCVGEHLRCSALFRLCPSADA